MPIERAAAVFVMLLLGCGGNGASNECEGLSTEECARPECRIPNGGAAPRVALVVDTDWLEAHLGDPDVQLVDTRASGYERARIPGAISLRPDDLAATVDGVPSQVAPSMQAQPVLRAVGLRNGVIAVVYGGSPEHDSSRIVWALRYYGHGDVRYLDGGYAAWVAAEGAVDTDPPSVESTQYVIVGVDEDLRVTGDWVLSRLGDAPYAMPEIQLVDARSAGEYASGHIPSAQSADWNSNLACGLLRSEHDLQAIYEAMDPEKTTVTYCVTGSRGSFVWLTLTALGYKDVRLYDGSWTEWGNGEFPVEP
jgi:thiosulfate/3-mercaptopyruvate sulfurtransferase